MGPRGPEGHPGRFRTLPEAEKHVKNNFPKRLILGPMWPILGQWGPEQGVLERLETGTWNKRACEMPT